MTWMTEDVELAPDWLQEEIRRESDDLRQWLGSQQQMERRVAESAERSARVPFS